MFAFGALALATVGAFFVTQHLKVTTPLIAGLPRPVPGVINPYGSKCGGVDHGRMRISFYLLHRSDEVAVYVIDSSGAIVRTLASGVHMGIKRRMLFYWNGRQDNGSVAPDGIYNIRVALLHQGRTVEITDRAGEPEKVQVKSTPPRPVVTGVSPALLPQGSSPVTITYGGTEHRSGIIRLYRTDPNGRPRLVKSFKTRWNASQARWDGLIHRRPAPAGTYLVGLDVTDAACNTGHFPALLPPVPGTTPHAGVSVRYLAAQPPLTGVPAGSKTLLYVDARRRPYRWALWRVGARKARVRGVQRAVALHVKLPPAAGAGLYHVVITAGGYRTDVPLVAEYPGTRNAPHVLVVLPALTWQGQNQVDDDGDGIPNTLAEGGPVALNRVFAQGLPGGFADEAGLLDYLDRSKLPYDLTTDVALAQGSGPKLSGHTGVVLAGSLRWVPAPLAASLRGYVNGGGRLLSVGTDSLLRGVTLAGNAARRPTAPAAVDALGAKPGPFVAHSNGLVTVIRDSLGIFTGTSGAFPGYRSFRAFPSVAAPSGILSSAGVTTGAPAIIGYRLGRGLVVNIGLSDFGSSLAHSVDAKELVNQLWKVLRR